MFSVEIKINGNMIGYVYGHNKGYINKKGKDIILNNFSNGESKDLCLYYVEYYVPAEGKTIDTFTVEHNRDEGIEVLLKKIFHKLIK